MKVFIADDQKELRSALRLLIEQEQEIEVVGEAAEALSMVERIHATQPDLVLLDWELPGIEPIISPEEERHLLSVLRTHCTHVEIVALSGRPEAEKEALASGARAFISKGEAPQHLVSALRDIKTQSEKNKKEEER